MQVPYMLVLLLYSADKSSKSGARLYIGVEWDEKGRGKHDGAVGGKRYFVCPPLQGSFIHPDRVKPGVSLLTAIKRKYAAAIGIYERRSGFRSRQSH